MRDLLERGRLVEAPTSPPAHLFPAPSAPRCATIAAAVGDTPILWIDRPFSCDGRGFWAKLEDYNPGGLKDRPALYMIDRARLRGELSPGATIVESTSGTFGLGLALAGIVFGHPVTLVTDPGMEPSMRRLLAARGATVDVVTSPAAVGGWQEARRRRVTELLDALPGAYCPDQYANPDAVAAYSALALELVAQLGRVDVLVCSVGTGGHSAGIARTLREFCPHLRLVGVDTVGSTIFGQPARPRLMRGLGSSILPGNVDYAAFDEVHWVAPGESVWACRQLARASYASGGWSVGAVALVAGWIARSEDRDLRIAAVFADGPLRYLDTVYDDDYCRTHDLLDVVPADQPDEINLATDREVVRWTRCRQVGHPVAASADSGERP